MKTMKTLLAVGATAVLAVVAVAQEAAAPRRLRLGTARPAARPTAATADSPVAEKPAGSGATSIEFNQTPLDLVIEVYQNLVGKTVLKDPGTPSPTITLKPKAGQALSDEDKIEAIEAVLEMNGVHFEPYGEKFVRALPRGKVRKEGIPLIMDPESELRESTRVVSVRIPFKNISAQDEAMKALEGFKSDTGILLVFERTNSILATDTEQNIKRMLEIAKSIDIASPVLENVFVRQIKHAVASEIKQALETIVQESQKELEKDGKAVQNAQNAAPASRPMFGASRGGLLGRQPKANQPETPAPNASLVMSVSDADRGMIRGKVLILSDERSNKLIIITQKSNMDFFDKVIEQLDIETTPDTQVKVYRLKYAEAEEVSDMINDLIGNAPSSKNSSNNQNQNAKAGSNSNLSRSPTAANAPRKTANQKTNEAKAGELSKDNTVVLADKRINGLVVMTQKELVPVVESIIESMDIKLSQVLIETVIIEVGLGDGIETGMDWVQKGRKSTQIQKTNPNGENLFYVKRTTTQTQYDEDGETILSQTVTPMIDYTKEVLGGYEASSRSTESRKIGEDTFGNLVTEVSEAASTVFPMVGTVVRSGLMNTYGGGTSVGLGGGSDGGNSALGLATGLATNLLSKSFSFVFDSDELGLSAILHAAKTDSHSKYIASPIIMTLDNKEATIEATSMTYLFKGYTYSGSTYNGSAVPDYEQKELGITIKVTPKINPNGTVMLTLEEEYSQQGSDQAITAADGVSRINAATTVTRKMSADALLENNQTVIFAGMTETYKTESETGIPFLKDLPFIGWLFGSREQNEKRSELLVFMTPYVLNDANAAEAEALRRKKAISDPRAWDDHGWSLSKLADPVSEKEMLRRLKDEWKKQDEERRTRLEVEKEKVKRAKALKEMTLEERNAWIKLHQKELDEEAQEELEKKLLDKESQEELKKLAAKVRKEKLEEAEREIKKMEEMTTSQNERAKLDAAKAEDEKAKAAEAEDERAKLDAAKSEKAEEAK